MVKALKTNGAKIAGIGDNSGNASQASEGPKVTALMNELAKLGNEYRAGTTSANRLQLNAAVAFGNAVKVGTIKLEPIADSYAAIKAFAPHLWNAKLAANKQAAPFKVLVSQFRSFADSKVLDCASYDHVESARNGKDFFQAAYKLNVAIKKAAAPKPNVNAAFTAAALAKAPTTPAKKDNSKAGRAKAAGKAMSALLTALAAFKAKSLRNALSDLTAAQSKALDSAVANFL